MLLAALREGMYGLRLAMPVHFQIVDDKQGVAKLLDEENRVAWFLFFFPGLHMDLAETHRAGLGRALEHYARAMFEEAFSAAGPSAPSLPSADEPRTADPSWSPMVEAEHLVHDGASALQLVHRMHYQPGRETLLGHLLVPLGGGLFEARVMAVDDTTGYRESVLLMLATEQAKDGGGVLERARDLRQADFDDPRHDEKLPEHALSRTRAALRWLRTASGLRVDAPAAANPIGEIALARLGCALVPPPRFVRQEAIAGYEDPSGEYFHRVSFCGTDGIERFAVARAEVASPGGPPALRALAERSTRKVHEDAGVEDLRLRVDDLQPAADPPQVQIIVEGRSRRGALRNALHWLQDERGRVWYLSLTGTTAVPATELLAELAAAARSFRLTG